ncbi:MAG: hypothetical protein SWE60_06125 [Thermodesulfobacteriota bacterium]|nr:hypothetical protein [Thermodesulfobacteriota bacterium]
MAKHVSGLILDLERQRRLLNAYTGKQLHSESQRAELRRLAENYFQDIRPAIAEISQQQENVRVVDASMQNLVERCHKRGTISRYLALLKEIKRHLISLDTQLIAVGANRGQGIKANPLDQQIVITLRALLPSAALSYEQAIVDISQPNRLSWRGPATDLREALRETLDLLAPDKEVKDMSGYKAAPGAHRPTMRQKVRYIWRNRGVSKTLAATSEDAAEAVDNAVGQFVRSVYNRSSVSTHTPTDRAEVVRILDLVRVVLSELLEIQR